MSSRTFVAAVVVAPWMLATLPAWSQPKEAGARAEKKAAGEPQQAALAEAKELFKQGVALFEAGEYESALDKFSRSRAAYASSINTINAALCLDKLQRYDEALELYEITIAKFFSELDAQDKADVQNSMAILKQKVGTVEVSSNVEGNVVIDGRPRGKLPLTVPLRVLPGRHVLRVIRDSYSTYETTFDIAAKERKQIDARLKPLLASGGLRIEDPTNKNAEIVVDGAVVGPNPFEGSFAPGSHLVQSVSPALGSRPTVAIVVKGQTTLVRLKSEPLGPVVFVSVTPSTAELALDGVPLGHGRWQGAIPVGSYRISASEEGYFGEEKRVDVLPSAKGAKAQRLTLGLQVDRSHPRWPKEPSGHFWVRGLGSFLVGPDLRSGPETHCTGACDDNAVLGFAAALRVGYELPSRLSFEVTGGYLSLVTEVNREITQPFPKGAPMYTTTYALDDSVRLRGPIVGGGASYRVPVAKHWSFVGRATVGVLFATATDSVTGSASTGKETSDVTIPGAGDSVSSQAVFVISELGGSYAIGSWQVTGSLALLFLPQFGPELPRSQIIVPPSCDAANPGGVGCTPVSEGIASERAYGPFALFAPQVGIGYTF